MKDAVITEIHQIKDAIAREQNYNVRAILAYAQKQFPARKSKPIRRRTKKPQPA
jgi:hypothetical protein